MTYFKAVRPDGTDFYTGTVRWAPEQGEIPAEGIIVTHPTSTVWREDHSTHLCASVAPADCTGFEWPCRLLEVEPVDEVYSHARNKRSSLAWRVVRELPATTVLGPQGAAVVALIDGVERLDAESLARLNAAWGAAWDAAWGAAWDAAWDAARDAAWDAAWDAVRDAAVALVAWDLIAPDHRDALTAPIRAALPDLWADVSARLPDIR